MTIMLTPDELKGSSETDLPAVGDRWFWKKKQWRIDRVRRLMNGGMELIFVEQSA